MAIVRLFRRIYQWISCGVFYVPDSNKELEVRRGWDGNVWISLRDEYYEINLKLIAADADKLSSWLRQSQSRGKFDGLQSSNIFPIFRAKANSSRGPRSPK